MKERLRRLGARLLRGPDGRIRWRLIIWAYTPLLVAALLMVSAYLYPLVGGPDYEPRGGSGYDRNREYAVFAERYNGDADPDNDDSAVFVMRADGSKTRKLMDLSSIDHVSGEDLAWSPDGKRILFSYYESPPATKTDPVTSFTNHRIYVTSADGSEKTRLAEGSGYERLDSARWSPDGRRVAFGCDDDICVVDADGGEILRLTDDDAMDREESQSPDSWQFQGLFTEPSWRSNEEVAFLRPGVKTDVQYATAADGSGPLRRIENREKEQEEREKVASPDGTEKAYVCDQDESVEWRRDDEVGEDFKICVEETGGDKVQELRGAPGYGHDLEWSPDGRRIAFLALHTEANELFTSKPGSDLCDIYVADRAGSVRMRRVIEDAGEDVGCSLSWTPDGRWLLYEDNGGLLGRNGIYAIRPDGSSGPKFVAAEPRSPEENLQPPKGYDTLDYVEARPRGD